MIDKQNIEIFSYCLLGLGVLWKFLPHLLETSMKSWVKLTIIEFIEKTKEEFKKEFREFREEIKAENEKLVTLFEEYKKYQHDRLSNAAQYEGTVNICLEALKEAKETLKLASQIKKNI